YVASEARGQLEGTADLMSDYAAAIEHDPRALQAAFERLTALEGLTKRYGPTLDAVLARREQLLALADVSENSEIHLHEAHAAEAEARTQLEKAAQQLSAARRSSAKDFIVGLAEAARDLELGKVRFDIAFKELPFEQWTEQGSERAEILYAPTAAIPARPLAKIASGGEISRVMLALKSVLGAADDIAILVFDEIDAGIGGAAGLAIGAKLKKLAQTHQVIVVTHLAQVAAYADQQFKVSKESSGSTVKTLVATLGQAERVGEIARMLSGSTSETAVQHAHELLSKAAN
ncbi:MAG: DNA repair protein RecN, partial [Coriobacteriia bacterium]|nr:DNA repair protein RecN [Coriobacteriia bacterium]